jgi:error-prone DNA polymerase
MEVKGRVEMDDEVIHVIVSELTDATQRLAELSHDLLAPSVARADEVNRPARTMSGVKQAIRVPATRADPRAPAVSPVASSHPRNVRILPRSRDFH